mmetsp:Transcript_40483/g.95187  ORF Transcript_40483/g.95187 Transcript_40483/m.95187 type:complete len:184 (+) Transcript_40483:83-634(+)
MAKLLPRALLLVAACALAQVFLPAFVAPGLARRELILGGSAAASAVLASQAAWADAQGEPTAILWRYGSYIANLEGAIEKGDMKAVLKSEKKFELLNSYWRNKAKKERVQSRLVDQIMVAAEKKDTAKVKQLFAEYKQMDNWTEFLSLPPADTTNVGTLQKGMGGGIRESTNPNEVRKLNYGA